MKHIISIIIILFGSISAQEFIVTKNGKEISGKYIKHDAINIYFIYDGQKSETKIPIQNIEGVKLKNGKILDTKIYSIEGSTSFIKSTIILNNGKRFEGKLDKKSFESKKEKNLIKFKSRFGLDYKSYSLNSINFIKSWNGSIIYPVGVVGNKNTKFYHLPTVRHLPTEKNKIFFNTEKEAKVATYNACGSCYDNSPLIPDYTLESNLVKSTIIAFQNNNEILYEHPRLSELQIIIDNILLNWPAALKGYDYRIQIYKDEAPNAMAVGGGNLYISSGLLNMIENPLELESVLAHEVGHVERRHSLRQFKIHQAAQGGVIFGTILLAAAAVASGANDNELTAVVGLSETILSFSAALALKGYSREFEQESDIMAQLYLNNVGKDKKQMVNLLDKLATYHISRNGYLEEGVHAFNSHPSLVARINQVEKSVMYNYEKPLIFSANPNFRTDISPGFVKMEMDYIFRVPSSNKNENIFYVLGKIKNHHPELSFKINKLSLSMKKIENKESNDNNLEGDSYIITNNGKELSGTYIGYNDGMIKFKYKGKENISSLPIDKLVGVRLADGSILNSSNILSDDTSSSSNENIRGKIKLEGLNNIILLFDSETEFTGFIRSPINSSNLLFKALKNKDILINDIDLSAVVMERGTEKDKSVAGFKSIKSSMIVE
ncbi:M48 family metallopeptidase [Candidatus Marinimicrobia bacterium]|nr:M48 family metallopeptidase [Candidatus Neomarinimicrobiota bacterium]